MLITYSETNKNFLDNFQNSSGEQMKSSPNLADNAVLKIMVTSLSNDPHHNPNIKNKNAVGENISPFPEVTRQPFKRH